MSDNRMEIEDVYRKKTLYEHIMTRSDTYIGSLEFKEDEFFVLEGNIGKFKKKNLRFVPGLFKIFDEILVNAADNHTRDKSTNIIRVEIDAEHGRICIYNNGPSIPIEIHKEYQVYVAEMLFGQLLSGSNFNDEERRTTGGKNGYGAKLTNIFSK